MARISDLLAAGRTYSFEFFPPKTDGAQLSLGRTIAELEPLARASCRSPTAPAAAPASAPATSSLGAPRDLDHADGPPHLPGPHPRPRSRAILDDYRAAGIENILALGGDPPADPDDVRPSDYTYATDLIDDIDPPDDFSIGVAAHPEVHPRSPDRETDRRHLAAKLRRADFAITQFFFEASTTSAWSTSSPRSASTSR